MSAEITRKHGESRTSLRLLPIVHGAQIPIFAAALATGLLLFYPALRLALTSGYSGTLREVHRWSGRGQVLLAVLLVGTWARLAVVRGHAAEDHHGWRAWRLSHVTFVSAAALGLLASGIVLSTPRSFSLTLVDYSLAAHLGITALSCGVIVGHAFLALAYPQSRLFIAPVNRADASHDRPLATDGKATRWGV
jgi:hypothetical protein